MPNGSLSGLGHSRHRDPHYKVAPVDCRPAIAPGRDGVNARRRGQPVAEQPDYVEVDRAGNATPSGLAPTPSVMHSAIATRLRLDFGDDKFTEISYDVTHHALKRSSIAHLHANRALLEA